MTLLERSTQQVALGSYVTISEGARLKRVDYHAMRMWLRNHPEVPVVRLGKNILVRKDELEKYDTR